MCELTSLEKRIILVQLAPRVASSWDVVIPQFVHWLTLTQNGPKNRNIDCRDEDPQDNQEPRLFLVAATNLYQESENRKLSKHTGSNCEQLKYPRPMQRYHSLISRNDINVAAHSCIDRKLEENLRNGLGCLYKAPH